MMVAMVAMAAMVVGVFARDTRTIERCALWQSQSCCVPNLTAMFTLLVSPPLVLAPLPPPLPLPLLLLPQEVWSAACRLMQTHIRTYSGDQLASLVAALVALDQEDSSGSTSGSSSSSSGSSSSGSGSGSGFLGVRQLEHPAMQGRLQALARDGGGISGDGAAGVLLGLVVSGATVPADQLAALVG